jgi:hypothetical protein
MLTCRCWSPRSVGVIVSESDGVLTDEDVHERVKTGRHGYVRFTKHLYWHSYGTRFVEGVAGANEPLVEP